MAAYYYDCANIDPNNIVPVQNHAYGWVPNRNPGCQQNYPLCGARTMGGWEPYQEVPRNLSNQQASSRYDCNAQRYDYAAAVDPCCTVRGVAPMSVQKPAMQVEADLRYATSHDSAFTQQMEHLPKGRRFANPHLQE